MEFPGLLGIGLYRLRLLLRSAPFATLGPLFGIMGAKMALDISHGRFGSMIIELVMAPVFASTIMSVAQRDNAGIISVLMFIVGGISALGASILLARGLAIGSSAVFVMGVRHLTVGAYAWATIATEPPLRREVRFAPVGT